MQLKNFEMRGSSARTLLVLCAFSSFDFRFMMSSSDADMMQFSTTARKSIKM
jgi:hypothetical protein